MKLLIAGGDLRFAWAARLAQARGLAAATVGLEKSWLALPQADPGFLRGADAVLAPNPWRTAFPGPFAAGDLTFDDLLAVLPPGAALILPDDLHAPPDAPAHICLSDSESYLLRNADLTAEGAVHAAMSAVPFALDGAAALVIGYGRIGRALARRLAALDCAVTVAARREAAREEAHRAGHAACSMEALEEALPPCRLVFSTPPAPVLTEERLARISPEALLMDVASAPYGFPLDKARALGLRALRENNLPGRYCPESAGRLLLEAALEAARKGEIP